MDAIATKQAEQDLDGLIERVIADVQPTILCNDKGDLWRQKRSPMKYQR